MTTTVQSSTSKFPVWSQLLIWLVIISIWGLFTGIFIITSVYKAGSMHDYNAYYNAARRLNNDQQLYISIEASQTYLYPPLLAQMLTPIEANFPRTENAVIWIIFNIFCLLLTIFLLALQATSRWKRYFVWLLPFLFLPIIETYINGQIVPVMILLITGAMIAHKHNRALFVGLCLAIATWLKIYPIFIIFYFVLRRDWRVVGWSFIVGMVLLFLQIGLSSVELMTSFFTETLFQLASNGQDFNMFRNHAIFGFTHRLFADTPFIAKLLQWGIAGIMVAVMIFVYIQGKRTTYKDLSKAEFELEYGAVVTFMLLMGSTLLSTSMLPIVLPIAIALFYVKELRHYIIWATAFFGASFTFGFTSNDITMDASPILQGYGFYAIITLWGILVYLRWKEVQSLSDDQVHNS